VIKKPIPIFFNLDSQQSVQSCSAVIHIEDNRTETLDLSLLQGGEHIKTPSNSTVTARFVRIKDKILISDNVACAVQENGNILIPIDNAAAHMLTGEIKIEVNIVDNNDVLTMQFPLVVRVNNSILEDAEISPESEGTIPELLEEAKQAAQDAQQAAEEATQALDSKQDKLTAGDNITISEENVISASSVSNDYTDLINKPSINNVTLSGNKTSDDLNLQDKLTAGENITISDDNVISAEGGGVTSYNELTDKPQINGITLSENKSATDLELKEIFFGTSNPPQDSYTKYPSNALWVNLNENTQFVLTATDASSSLLWFTWERLNNRVIQSTEPAPEYSGINVKYQYDNGDLWLQVDSGKITKISVCTGKDRQSLNYKTWRYFYYWAEFTGGGSQIVSGVVNANGTITFTDSEGNSFTTSGESVIGPDGFSPSATVQQTASGATITVTDKNGITTANITNGQDGNDYVLTAQDKTDIANIVLSELPTTQGVLYGNQSN